MDQVSTLGGTTTTVHFVYAAGEEWRIACMPNMTEFHSTPYHPAYQRANDVRAVRCPACERTAAFKDAAQMLETATKRTTRAT